MENHLALAKAITPSMWVTHDKKFQEKWNKQILKDIDKYD